MPRPLRYFRLWAAIGWVLVSSVVYLSLGPITLEGPEDIGLSDKAGHLVAYCVLMLWFGELYARRRRFIFALGFVVMGLMLELLQGAISYRSFEVMDILANATGVALGLTLGAKLFSGWLHRAEVWFDDRRT